VRALGELRNVRARLALRRAPGSWSPRAARAERAAHEIAKKLGLPLVATNNVQFINQEDGEASYLELRSSQSPVRGGEGSFITAASRCT